VGPTLHVLIVGPHVDQRGEYGLPSLTMDPTQWIISSLLVQHKHATWGHAHVTFTSLHFHPSLLIRHFVSLYRIRSSHVLLLTFASNGIVSANYSNCYKGHVSFFYFLDFYKERKVIIIKSVSVKIFFLHSVFLANHSNSLSH
jgi:hypothetical protein